jgi:xylulokinase
VLPVSDWILAVDLGTTAIKVAIYDRDGSSVAAAERECALQTPQPAWVELDCEKYWQSFVEVTRSLWRQVDPQRIAVVGLSVQGETLVPVDQRGHPLRPAIVWLDTRAQSEAAELRQRFGEKRIYEITGQPEMLAAWPAAKLLWLRRHEPSIVKDASKYLLLEDYFLFRMTGEFATEGSLTTSTCYWDFRSHAWWSEMLEEIGVDERQLPTLVAPGAPIGPLRADVASALGLAEGVTVCAGALDQACAAIGAGNVAVGGFSENTGAALALCSTLSEPRLDPDRAMPCHYHALAGHYMFHTFTSGGIVLRWFRDEFFAGESISYARLGELAATVPAGADGLLVLPHLQGAMAPENNDQARGVLMGLTLKHGRAHVARAIMESIAFVVRRNVDVLAGLGAPSSAIRAVGGGSRSHVWKQIEADVTGLPVITMGNADAGTLGAAILAGAGVGWWTSVPEAAHAMVAEKDTYEPDTATRALYDERYEAYKALYRAVEPVFPTVAA